MTRSLNVLLECYKGAQRGAFIDKHVNRILGIAKRNQLTAEDASFLEFISEQPVSKKELPPTAANISTEQRNALQEAHRKTYGQEWHVPITRSDSPFHASPAKQT